MTIVGRAVAAIWLARSAGGPRRPGRTSSVRPAAIVLVAQLTDPGTARQLAIIGVAVLGYVAWGLFPRLPAEVFAVLVIVPVAVVVGEDGGLEATFFLVVTWCSTRRGTWARRRGPWRSWPSPRRAVARRDAPGVVRRDRVAGLDDRPSPSPSRLGRALQGHRELIEQLEAAQEALAEQAVAEERRRIARELHDLAGHTLAAVLLHVTGARHVLRRDVDEAERALVDAETVGRASLDQIRATVAALRTDERGTDAALAGSADLAALVDEYRRAGLAIETDVAPTAARIEGPAGTALHRIAREALANVAHHAPGNTVVVTVEHDAHGLRLRVVDHGQAPATPTPGPGHFGIIGMRERARALGGQLDAGPTRDGWAVDAQLPPIPVGRGAEVPS